MQRSPDGRTEARSRAEFGSDDVHTIPLSAIINIRQVRETVDPEELEKLKSRIPYFIDDDGVARFDLTHPIMVNIVDRDHLEAYILDHDLYYGEASNLDIDTLPRLDNHFAIRIVGHMRGAVARAHCQDLGIDPEDALISASLKYNLPFIEANRLQNIENTHVVLRPVEDARSIERHFAWMSREGASPSVKVLADYFGYSEDKIRSALRFVQAPSDIQAFVGNGLSYGNVVSLMLLREAYERSYVQRESIQPADRRDHAEQSVRDFFEVQLRNKLRGSESTRIGELIKAKIAEVQKTATYYTDELFFIEESTMQQSARQKVRKDIGDAAVQALTYLYHQGVLTDEQRTKIAAIAAKE